MPPTDRLLPVKLGKDGDDGLFIEWNDGHRSRHTWKHLRVSCPCATCNDERLRPPNPFKILTEAEATRPPLAPLAMTPVGYYAYKFSWNDGHDTGIFTLENLRDLCECPQCRPK